MELMTLLAKLTIDKSQYDKGLEEAERDAKDLKIEAPIIPKPDNKEFKEGLTEAEETGNWFKEAMSGVWQGVKDAIVATGIVSVVTSIIGAMRQGVNLAINQGKAINDGAKNLKLSTKAYQQYEYVLGKSGLKMKDLSTAMKRMDDLMGNKKLNEEQTEWLKKLGINAEGAANKEQLLADVMAKLADYNDTDKGRIVEWLFGSNQNWDGYFTQTSKEIEGLKKEADDLGYVMSDESVQNSVKFNEASEKLADRVEAIKRGFGEGILPVITSAVEGLTKIVDFFTGGKKTTEQQFADADKAYESSVKKIEGDAKAAEYLANKLVEMGDTSKMDDTTLAIWEGTAGKLIEMVPTLSGLIDVENKKINANTEELKDNIAQYSKLQKETALQNTSAEKQNTILSKRNELVEKSKEVNENLAKAEGRRQEALEQFNAVLEKYEHEKLGEGATIEDINKAEQDVLLGLAGNEYGAATASLELIKAKSPLTDAINAAQSAQDQVDKLTEEIEKGQSAYDEWIAAQSQTAGNVKSEADSATEAASSLNKTLNELPSQKDIYINVHYPTDVGGFPKAIGGTIPYDNFPALLHRGEKVLTATEVRRGKGADSVDLSGLEERVAAAVRSGMDGVTVNSYLNGRLMNNEMNRETMRQVKAGRFRK